MVATEKSLKNRRRKPLQTRSQQSVKAIVEASAQVLVQRGYKGATTNRIAERAGVSVGSLYQYFNNKDEIFDELIRSEADSFLGALEQNIPKQNVDLRGSIRALIEAGYAHHNLILGIQAMMRNLPGGAYSERMKLIRHKVHELAVKFLQQHAPKLEVRDQPIAADALIALAEGMTFLGRVDRSPGELIDILTDSMEIYLVGAAQLGRG